MMPMRDTARKSCACEKWLHFSDEIARQNKGILTHPRSTRSKRIRRGVLNFAPPFDLASVGVTVPWALLRRYPIAIPLTA
jgi:hypothetical protein